MMCKYNIIDFIIMLLLLVVMCCVDMNISRYSKVIKKKKKNTNLKKNYNVLTCVEVLIVCFNFYIYIYN